MSNMYPDIDATASATGGKSSKVAPESQVGKPDYNTEPGPKLNDRQCRDKFFLVLFALFWVGMIVIAGLAIEGGNLDRLRYGNDSDGDLCGANNVGGKDLTELKYQYTFNPTSLDTYRRCVSACPNETYKPICPYGIIPPSLSASDLPLSELIKSFSNNTFGNCTLTYRSKSILNRCVPDIAALKDLVNKTIEANPNSTLSKNAEVLSDSGDLAAQIFSDVSNSWNTILICSFVSLVLSFVWLLAVQFFAKPLVWFTIIITNLAAMSMTGALWSYWYSEYSASSSVEDEFAVDESGKYQRRMLFAMAVIVSVLTGLLVLLSLGLRSRINLAIAVIQETAKAIKKMPSIVVFPIFKYIALSLLIAWTIYIWANLATAGNKVSSSLSDSAASRNYTSVDFEPNKTFQYLSIYYGFGFLWTFNWILAISQSTIAGAIATWYWTRDKDSMTAMPVFASFMRTMRYHLGSMAFGSLIIAIVQFIRATLMYVQYQLKRQKASRVAQFLLSCLQCCFACVEKVLKFLNKNAYIEIAVYGYDFCEGARMAFELLVRNAVRVLVVDHVADFLFLLGKLMITLLTALVGSAMLQSDSSDVGRFWGVSLVLIVILAYTISSAFMAVFDMAISTLFLCFCEDSERNDGSAAKPYYMEASLREFVNDAAKATPKSVE